MLLILLAGLVAAICFIILTAIFGTYLFTVARTHKKSEYLRQLDQAMSRTLDSIALPKLSILIPVYNEEKVIEAKLKDIKAMQYPPSKLETILIDDASKDDTIAVAEHTFNELHLSGKVVRNATRMGVNGCYNRGVSESNGDLIVTTDADVMVDREALIKSVKVLQGFPDVGGVTSRMVPISETRTSAVRIERSYRDFYDTMCVAESAIHSTFPGYTTFAVVRKTAFPIMPLNLGSSDGNISLAIIRKGLRYICVPTILFYEPIAKRFREQARQKTRRGARQIQAAWINRDLLFNEECGAFGRKIFPLRFLWMMISPPLFMVGCLLLLASLVSISIFWIPVLTLFLFITYMAKRCGSGKLSLIWSLVVHESYLFVGLLLSLRVRSVWKPIERTNALSGASRPP